MIAIAKAADFFEALALATGITPLMADQEVTRRAYPYMIWDSLNSQIPDAHLVERHTRDKDPDLLTVERRADVSRTFSLNFHNDVDHPEAIATAAWEWLVSEASSIAAQTGGFRRRIASQSVEDRTIRLSQYPERRAGFDVRFDAIRTWDEGDIERVKTVLVTGEIDGADQGEQEITV